MSRPEPSLYQTLRFWHRWASLLTAPFLLIISLTGALLVFPDLIDQGFRPGANRIEPSGAAVSIQAAMLVGPTHVGTVLGWPGRVIALLTCLVLVALAGTGFWLWLKAPGLGPVRSNAFVRYPWSLKVAILALGILFPLAGLSLFAGWLGLTLFLFARRRLRAT